MNVYKWKEREIYFKALAHMMGRLPSPKSAGSSRLKTHGKVDGVAPAHRPSGGTISSS